MRGRFSRLGAFVALTAALVLVPASNATARVAWSGACQARLEKARRLIAAQLRDIDKLQATGDCSYLDRIIAFSREIRPLAAANVAECSEATQKPWTESQIRAQGTPYCKNRTPKAKPTESASQETARKRAAAASTDPSSSNNAGAKPGANQQKSTTAQTGCEGSSERNPCTFKGSPLQGTPKGKSPPPQGTPKVTGIPKTTIVSGKPTACFVYTSAKTLLPVDCSTPGALRVESPPSPPPIEVPPAATAPEVPDIVEQPSASTSSPQPVTIRPQPRNAKNKCPDRDRNGNLCVQGTPDSEANGDWTIYKIDVTNSCECTCSVTAVDSLGVGRTVHVNPHSNDRITCIQTPKGGCTGFKRETATFTCRK
jgi:hypothetical protein